jgi:hypothetical protein
MANAQAMCTSFKVDLLNAVHAFSTANPAHTAATADTFKAALYLTTASQGGITVTNATAPTSSGTTAYWTPSASLVYSSVTLTTAFDTVLIYNNTQSNKAVSVHTFGSQTVTAGTFTLTMPANAAGTALLNLA